MGLPGNSRGFRAGTGDGVKNPFPDFVGRLPLRDYGMPGLIVHVASSASGETYFVIAEKEIVFPEHAHGAQFTMVVSGECDFTADGRTVTYRKGDSYFIPAGKKHQITLHPGYAEMSYVLNSDAGNGAAEENQQTGTGMRKIDEDLKKGFELESQGVVYLAFARKAEEEGMDHIARLFRVAAESEKVHALNHYAFMNKIGDTKAN